MLQPGQFAVGHGPSNPYTAAYPPAPGGYPSQPGYPPQGGAYPPAPGAYPPSGSGPQGYPPSGYPGGGVYNRIHVDIMIMGVVFSADLYSWIAI